MIKMWGRVRYTWSSKRACVSNFRCEEEWETPNGVKGLVVQDGDTKSGKMWDVLGPNYCICLYCLEYSLLYSGILSLICEGRLAELH